MKACLFSCAASRPASPSSPELEAALQRARAEAEPVRSFSYSEPKLFKPVPQKASSVSSLSPKLAPGPALEMDPLPDLPHSPQSTMVELEMGSNSCMMEF